MWFNSFILVDIHFFKQSVDLFLEIFVLDCSWFLFPLLLNCDLNSRFTLCWRRWLYVGFSGEFYLLSFDWLFLFRCWLLFCFNFLRFLLFFYLNSWLDNFGLFSFFNLIIFFVLLLILFNSNLWLILQIRLLEFSILLIFLLLLFFWLNFWLLLLFDLSFIF